MSETMMMFFNQYTTVISNLQNILGKWSGRIIDSVIDHNFGISKYNPLGGSNYSKSLKELYYPRKDLINIQNIEHNESCKWCLVK